MYVCFKLLNGRFVARHESILMSAGHSFVVFLVSSGILFTVYISLTYIF